MKELSEPEHHPIADKVEANMMRDDETIDPDPSEWAPVEINPRTPAAAPIQLAHRHGAGIVCAACEVVALRAENARLQRLVDGAGEFSPFAAEYNHRAMIIHQLRKENAQLTQDQNELEQALQQAQAELHKAHSARGSKRSVQDLLAEINRLQLIELRYQKDFAMGGWAYLLLERWDDDEAREWRRQWSGLHSA